MTEQTILFIVPLVMVVGGVAVSAWRWHRLAARQPRVILTGGGTGGHVNPALAIAEEIKSREPECRFLYVGVRGKAEKVIVSRVGYPLKFISTEGFPGLRPSWRSLRFLLRISVGVVQSVVILLRFAPRWVIATGGYVSAPIILATILLRLFRLSPTRVFLHEQNSVPGQLNGLLGRWVDRVLLTFPQTLMFFPKNGVVVGYPIRHSIVLKPIEQAAADLGFELPPDRQVVFVFGGSQGARTLNRAIVDALRYLLPYREQLFIIHGMGLSKSAAYDAVADTEARLQESYSEEERALLDSFYYRQDYFHNIADVYSVSDLIVCRSGAGSLNELSQLGKPSLIVPKANLPGDHQVMNARAMKHAGAADILFEDTVLEGNQVLEKVEGELLADRVWRLLQDTDRRLGMAAKSQQVLRRHANERILSELYGDKTYNNGIGFHTVPFRPLFNNSRLLQLLSAAYRRSPADYDPLTVAGDEDDLIYYRHRAASLLSHGPWQDRNLGVKLVGLTQYREKIPTLLHMLADRTPESRLKRLCGGDFQQVGFIRRNIVQALRVMNQFNANIERHLASALQDPYFEVRSECCRTAAYFGRFLAGKEVWLQALLERLDDDSFEVVIDAAKALGELGADGRWLEVLLNLKEHPHWKVRDAALQGIKRLLERRVISPSAEFLTEIASFVLTSTDFRPHFSIKETYRTIESYCRERLTEETLPESSTLLSDSVARKL